MLWYRTKKAIDIVKKEGRDGLVRVLHKLTKYHDKPAKTLEALNLIEALDFSMQDLERNRQLMTAFEREKPAIRSINWFIPFFEHAYYGGIHTILRFAAYFSRSKGLKTRLVLYDNPYVKEEEIQDKVKEGFPELAGEEVFVYRGPEINAVPYADITVCTLWTSAYQLLKFNNTLGKFYFIQDYEALFYPAGSYYALSEATYRFGFHGIVNTPGLYAFLARKYGLRAEFFHPAVDRTIFYPSGAEPEERDGRYRLFFYGRPQHDRNAFELAIATAKKIKAVLGDRIDIISAGSEWDTGDYGVSDAVTNLGLLGYRETAEVYRNSDFGLILMFTKHPSYLPLELMASGSIVITNYNDANTWLLDDGSNSVVVQPSPTCITEKFMRLIGDHELRKTIRANALKTISAWDWNTEMEKIYRFITGRQ